MRWIYLSPHLDDAVLSAGGLIHDQVQAGIPVEIWTLMCGFPREEDVSPFAETQHTMWGFASGEETTRKRREEDKQAAAILGAGVLHFDFLDCIYRRAANGEWLYTKVFGAPHPEDAVLPAQIADEIAQRLQPEDVLVCQLAIGSHVDHILVRQGAELLGHSLRYDIDVPYILHKPEELSPKSAGMTQSVRPISEAGLRSWKEAVLAYTSQVAWLGEGFETPERVRQSIDAYREQYGGIILLQFPETGLRSG